MSNPVKLSLVICTYQRPHEVKRLLEAVVAQTSVPDEILVVDNSHGTATARAVNAFLGSNGTPGLVYYKVPAEHSGLTRQRNYGIARSGGDIIAFLDDDAVPAPDYFAEILACFGAHPDAVGVGGYIVGEIDWRRVDAPSRPGLAAFRFGDWERREDYRWRLRKIVGLASDTPPGWMPPSGHGRSVTFFPPDGKNHEVETILGGASAWKRALFDRLRFSRFFEGYGLYEDLDFCISASRAGSLYVCTRAHLTHDYAPSGRPAKFQYGKMVVRNGWYVWRRRWPLPRFSDRLRWWATSVLLAVCRLMDSVRGPARKQALAETAGRLWGMAAVLGNAPEIER